MYRCKKSDLVKQNSRHKFIKFNKEPSQIMPNSDPLIDIVLSHVQGIQQVLDFLKSPSPPEEQIELFLKPCAELAIALQDWLQRTSQQQTSLNESNMTGNPTIKFPRVLPYTDILITGKRKPQQVWNQLLETLKIPTAEQPQQILALLKANPQLKVSFITPRTAEQHGQVCQQQKDQMLLTESKMTGNPTMKQTHLLPNTELLVIDKRKPTNAWNQLVEVIKSPSAQQPQQISTILEANPHMKAAFLKHQIAQQQKQSPQQQEKTINESNMKRNSKMNPREVLPNSDLSKTDIQRPIQVWNQFKTLKSPSAQQQRIRNILKVNTQQTAAFLTQRTAQKQEQLPQQQKQEQMLLNEDTLNIKTYHEELLLNRRNRDDAIKVKRKMFNCHNCILGGRFPVFMEQDMNRNANGILTVEDSEPTTFQNFLIYLYTGNNDHLSWKNFTDRYMLANKYCVGNMEKICAEYIKKNISTRNFYDFFLLSHMHNDREIIDITIQFFLENSEDITESTKWAEFVTDNPVESDELIKALHCK